MNTQLTLATLASMTFAQTALAMQLFQFNLDSGSHTNSAPQETIVFARVLAVDGLSPLQVHFTRASLGRHSFIRLTSLKDGEQQRLDAATLALWRNTSAWFNGDAVLLELVAGPSESGVSVLVEKVVVPEPLLPKRTGGDVVAMSICGDDDRVPSADNRIGRLFGGGCTGWLIANGAALTAGHCPGGNGGMLNGAFEVNVPPSAADGSPVAAAISDQFPIVSFAWQDVGIGGDWCVFELGPNNLGEVAHQKFGFFRVTDVVPSTTQDVRITGFGIDTEPAGPPPNGRNSHSFTQQTAVGDLDSLNSDGSLRYYDYDTDTEGASSGSPLIWEQTSNWTIGIHTTGNCTLTSDNYGTAFAYLPLKQAIDDWPEPGARYLDSVVGPHNPPPDGSLFRPYHTLLDAYNNVSDGATVYVVAAPYAAGPGSTNIGQGLTKTVRLLPATGPVTFGN